MMVARSSGCTVRACASNSASRACIAAAPASNSANSTTLGAPSIAVLSRWVGGTASITTIRSSAGNSPAARTFSTCSHEETTATLAPQSRNIYSTCSAVSVVYSGTSTAPSASTAKSVTGHSQRFSLSRATRSPLPTPHWARRAASARTLPYASAEVIGFHASSASASTAASNHSQSLFSPRPHTCRNASLIVFISTMQTPPACATRKWPHPAYAGWMQTI